MRAQVCEVNKALLSVHRVVQAGNRVVFAASGSYVEGEQTGETVALVEKRRNVHVEALGEGPGFQGAQPSLIRPSGSDESDTCALLANTRRTR